MATALACQQMVELVTDYLEGSLRWRTRRRFEKHLGRLRRLHSATSSRCARRWALLGTVPADSLSPEAQSTLLDAFRDFRR